MKRLVCLALLLCLLLCGCGGAAEGQNTPLLVLRYADNQPEDYPTTRAAEYFAQLVEERTQGKIRIRLYCNGELGDENQVFEQVQFGGIDMARVSLGTMAEGHPGVAVLSLPFLYDDAEHMWRVLDGPIGAEFLTGARQAGVVGLSWFDAGARSFYTRGPIHSMEDLRGLTIRVQESAFMSRMVELLGARPVQIPCGRGAVHRLRRGQTAHGKGGQGNLTLLFVHDYHAVAGVLLGGREPDHPQAAGRL